MSDIAGDPARIVGPAFYENHGDNQIPVAALLVVVALDGDEDGTKSTYIIADGQEPIVVHYGMAQLAARYFGKQMGDAVSQILGDGE